MVVTADLRSKPVGRSRSDRSPIQAPEPGEDRSPAPPGRSCTIAHYNPISHPPPARPLDLSAASLRRLSNHVIAAKVLNYSRSASLATRTEPPGESASSPANVLDCAFRGTLMPFCLLSHRSLLIGDDEPKTLPYANASICSMGADAGQCPLSGG